MNDAIDKFPNSVYSIQTYKPYMCSQYTPIRHVLNKIGNIRDIRLFINTPH